MGSSPSAAVARRSPTPRVGRPLSLLLLLGLLAVCSCARVGFGFGGARDDGNADASVELAGDGVSDGGPDAGADLAGDGPSDAAPDGPLPPGTHIWSRAFGHGGCVEAMVAAGDSAGNVYVAGSFRGQVDLGGGPLTGAGLADIYLASFGADGAHRWSRAFAGAGDNSASAIAADAGGNIYVGGAFEQTIDLGGGALTSAAGRDVFVASFTAAGTHRWSRGFAGGEPWVWSLAAGPGDALAVTGSFEGTFDLGGGALTGAGSHDIFVASHASGAGAHRWSRRFGGSGSDAGHQIAVGPGGEVFVSGGFAGSVDLGGGAMVSVGISDLFLASYAGDDGAHRWSRRIGGSGYEDTSGLVVDGAGNAVLLGVFDGTLDPGGGPLTSAGGTDIFLASYAGSDGAYRWAQRRGSVDWDTAAGLAAAPGDRLIVAGTFPGTLDLGGGDLTSAGGFDIFAASYSADDGAHQWSRRHGTGGSEKTGCVATAAGAVLLTGVFDSATDLGGGALVSAGEDAFFLASYQPAGGAHRWSRRFGGKGYETAYGVALGPDGEVFVVGSFEHTINVGGADLVSQGATDVFVASYGPTGAHRWSLGLGGAGADKAARIAVGASGGCYVLGVFQGTIDLGGTQLASAGGQDIVLVSLAAADGAHRWSVGLGGSGWDYGNGLAVADSGLFLAGSFDGQASFGGAPLTSVGEADVFVASYQAADGAHRWSRRSGGVANDSAAALAGGPGGHVHVAGSFVGPADFGGGDLTSGGTDAFVASYRATDGAHLWSRAGGGPSTDFAQGIAADSSAVVVVGSYWQTADFGGGDLTSGGGTDIFIASYQAVDGAHRWSLGLGGAGQESAPDVAVGPTGEIFVTGRFAGAVDFGGGPLTTTGPFDVFVLSRDASGGHRWAAAWGSASSDDGLAIATDGQVVAAGGAFAGVIDLGGGPLAGVDRAGFVALFAP